MLRSVVLSTLFLLPAGVTAAQQTGITVSDFFGNFEEASLIEPAQTGPDSFTLQVQSNARFGAQGSLGTWVCAGIRLNHLKLSSPSAVHIKVPNGNAIADLRAVYSYDRKTWKLVPVQRSSFDFDVPIEPGHRAVYFATFYPYPLSRMVEHNAQLTRSKFVHFQKMGQSFHGREIPLITITDPSVPDSRKHRAFLIGGTHGAETASLYGVEGMLDFLVSNDPAAVQMRRDVVWQIVPVLNVDAAAEGLDRRNAGGINLYYAWGYHDPALVAKANKQRDGSTDPSIPTSDYSQPETRSAMAAIRAFRPQVFLDIHSWHFGGDGYWGPDPAAESSAITQLKQQIAQFFKIQHWDHETYPFASAATVAHELNIGTTLPEFALCYDSDKRLKTVGSLRGQGVQILRGTYAYLKSLP